MFNFQDMTRRCIDSVKKCAGMAVDILVVDDGSEELFINSTVNVIRNDINLGFTNAFNNGVFWCVDRYKYLMCLNNDIVPEPNFIKALYDHLETNEVTGIASSILLITQDDKKIYATYGMDLICGHLACFDEEPKEVIYCDWLPTCSSLFRYEMIQYIGTLDRRFRNHCSDSEYCIRANQHGWNVAIIPGSFARHNHQTTTTAAGISPYVDQKKFIAKLAGIKTQELFNRLPLDIGENLWGNITFEACEKNDNTDKPTTT